MHEEHRLKTRKQLAAELAEARRRIARLEASRASVEGNGDGAVRQSARDAVLTTQQAYLLLCAAPLGIHECDIEGRITFVNAAQEAITGYTAEELLGTYVWDLLPPGPVKDALPAELKRMTREQPAPTPFFATNIRKNGESFEVRVDWNYLRNRAGQVTGYISIVSDITERKRQDDALRVSEEHYRTLAEATTDIVYIVDRRGTLLYANRSAAECIRIPASELVGKSQEDLFGPEVARRHLERIARVCDTGEPAEIDELFRFGPQQRWLNIRSIPLRDGPGRVTAVMGVCRDITDRKCAEAALASARDSLEHRVETRTAELVAVNEELRREIDERARTEQALRYKHDELRAIYDGMRDGLLVADVETRRLLRGNGAICRMLGRSEEELLAMSVADLHLPEDLPEAIEHFQAQAEGRSLAPLTIRVVRQGGAAFPVEISTSRFVQGGRPCMAGFFRDISERVRAAEALAESEAKYRRLVEATDTGYLILDGQGRVLDANDEYIRLTGHSTLAEIAGRTVVEWTAAHDRDRNATEVQKCLATGNVRGLEIDYVHPDGTILPVEINATCIDTKEGRRIVSLCRDISERRHAAEALEKERSTLKHLLQSSDHERQLIAYEIHDGLAQQLAGALMQFQAFTYFREMKPRDAAKAFDAAITMLRQGHFEARRLIAGVRPPILDESGVVEAIAHAVHEEGRRPGPRIAFQSQIEFDRLAPALENALYRICQEGLTNACRHSQSKKVRIRLGQHGDRVRLEIRDWGIGFDRTAVKEGCYGLAGIRQRARLLGGRCAIRSAVGRGTRIVVELPVVHRD